MRQALQVLKNEFSGLYAVLYSDCKAMIDDGYRCLICSVSYVLTFTCKDIARCITDRHMCYAYGKTAKMLQ